MINMKNISELLDIIALERIENNIFRGRSHSIGGARVFGGQVLAQALNAAICTVPKERMVHSMHGYFILGGDVTKPIIYDVDRIRDGRSFTTRRVVAIQNGTPIFNMAASFQVQEEGFDHQIPMPQVAGPEGLMNRLEIMSKYPDKIPPKLKTYIEKNPRPIEFRAVEEPSYINDKNVEPIRHIWLKAKGKLSDDPMIHRTIMAYASDYNLLGTAMQPHRVTYDQLVMASLDHAMWFHRPFRMDEWLLYALDSPSTSGGRGFTRGHFFNQQGQLVASVTQEGMMRKRR